MQTSEKNTPKDKKTGKRPSLRGLLKRIMDKDEIEVRARLRILFDFAVTAAVAYILGGASLVFGTYPFAIALLCSSKKRLLPIFLSLTLLTVSGDIPDLYVFTIIAIPLIRILAAFLPVLLDEMRASANTLKPTNTTALVPYTAKLPAPISAKPSALRRFGLFRKKNAEIAAYSAYDPRVDEENPILLDTPAKRIFCALIGGMLCGLFLLIRSEFSFYSLYAALSLMLICPIAVALFGGYLGISDKAHEPYLTVSAVAIGVCCTYAAQKLTVIGMPMAPFLAMLLTLYMTSSRGIITGGIASILLGLVLDPIYIPLLLISSLLFAIISSAKRGAGLAVVCAAVVVWCYYIGGTHGLTEILPPMLLAIPVYMLAAKYRDMICAPYDKSVILAGGVYFAEAVTEKNKNAAVRERLGALSEAFSVLSENFYKLSDRRRRPDALGLKKICEEAFEKSCDECPRREICWGNEYSLTLDAIKCSASSLHSKGCVKSDDLCEFKDRCIHTEQIIKELNDSLSRATEDIIKNDKLGFFASSYDDINEILRDALECDSAEYESDPDAQEKILELFFREGIRAKGAVVFGKRCRHVTVRGISAGVSWGAKRAAAIRREIEGIVNTPLTDPVFDTGGDGGAMHMSSKPALRTRYAYGRVSAAQDTRDMIPRPSAELRVDPFDSSDEGCEPCGDTANAFITNSSYFYSLISDGMGSGQEAAFISGVCSMFIEKMLSAGNRLDITVRMLNNILRNENMGSGGECSATVDLCELDLISGVASFLKCGAAPTYIARGGTVYKVYSRTMPIGILKNPDARISKFDTQKGDIIIMMSDGCCPDSEDCPWLVEYLCKYMSRKDKNANGADAECEALKDTLLSLAIKNSPRGKERDDISVSVIFVE